MIEILFVLGFFLMLMLTGISLLGIMAALIVGTLAMMIGGLFVVAIKVLPWLVLAVAVVWLYRTCSKQPRGNGNRLL